MNKNEKTANWLFLDLNSYFASVEQQERPELRGRPTAVVPMENDYTCCIAASYEAKAYGVKTGTKVLDAKRLCPDLALVLARHDKYRLYHDKVLEETIRHVPINKVWSIDELSSRLPERLRSRDAAVDAAKRLKAGLARNVGVAIRCSIGLAPNAFLAKVATDMEKPDGLVVLDHDNLRDRLFALRLTDLPGINVRMERRLRDAGIRSVEGFWNLAPKHARHAWGSVHGERFWYNLHGHDVPDLETSASSIGHSRVLESHLKPPDVARQVARRLTVKAASRLRRKDLFARTFTLGVRGPEESRWAGEARLPPCQDNYGFLEALDGLWDAMLRDLKPFMLKKVSVTMLDLCEGRAITDDLFDRAAPARRAERQRREALTGLIDTINRKHGAETLQLGVSPRTSAGFVGTKIAFNRVPDMEEFVE